MSGLAMPRPPSFPHTPRVRGSFPSSLPLPPSASSLRPSALPAPPKHRYDPHRSDIIINTRCAAREMGGARVEEEAP
eukprot:2385654-Rhodomonas_salina.1